MRLRGRLAQIENKLNYLDPDSDEYKTLDAEANDLADELNKVEEAYKARERAEESARQAKLDEIRRLNSLGKTDQLIDTYGHEFISDYHVSGNTITSSVAREDQNNQWTEKNEEDTNAKLRQLLYYRIYDHYIRVR